LLALLKPQDAGVWLIPADDFCKQPAPIRWLVKGWLQAEALIMVHGPSGGGKTFAVLDWVLRIAAGGGEWHGKPVKGGGVVYLAGEGHHGLRGRIAAWKLHNKVNELEMWLSKDGCDLNTTEGYQRVVEHIRSLPTPPRCIVVDTLHRFLFGDENSAQDAKTMLDACARLIAEFGCAVVLVHHTGNNDEAKHRARGSSAWRAALDNEISIIPGTCDGEPIQIVQRKCKDAEMSAPEYMVLQSVMLPGWIDEDGEQVGSAVAVQADAPAQIEAKKPSKLDEFRKTFENAWFASGAESLDGAPYLTRSALSAKLAADRYAARTIENMLKPSETNKLIGALMLAEIITPKHDGWVVSEPIQASAMMMRAGEKKAGDYK